MDDDAGVDAADDSFSFEDFSGWSDCECTGAYTGYEATLAMKKPAKQPMKKPRAKSGSLRTPIQKNGLALPTPTKDATRVHRRLSGSQSHSLLAAAAKETPSSFMTSTSVLLEDTAHTSKSVPFSVSSGPELAPVMILPVQEKISPLAKPFTIYKYTYLQPQKPTQTHVPVQYHVVTSPPSEDSSHQPSEPREDHLPPLASLRDALGAPSAKSAHWAIEDVAQTTSEPHKQSAPHVQQAASIKLQWTTTPQKHSSSMFRANALVSEKTTPNKKQLVKNDKPTVRSHITLAHAHGSPSRRYSDAGKRSHETQRAAHDSGYETKALYAPRRQSLCGSVSLDEEDEILLHEMGDGQAESRGDTKGLLRTLTQFSTLQRPDQQRHGSKYRSAVP